MKYIKNIKLLMLAGLLFMACFIAYANIATTSCQPQAESPVEQLVRIMISDTDCKPSGCKDRYTLAEKRNPNDYQDVYDLATEHSELLQGIIHNERTFAMLCVERGYADVLARLINKSYPVDLATPCYLYGPSEPQTAVLSILFYTFNALHKFKGWPPEDYSTLITRLTKLIINKYPDLLDIELDRARTPRQEAEFLELGDLIPSDLPQSAKNT